MKKKYFFGIMLLFALLSTLTAEARPKARTYNAKKVTMNVGSGSGVSIDFTWIGITKDGYEVWYGQNPTDKYAYTYWQIDDQAHISFCQWKNYPAGLSPDYPLYYGTRNLGGDTNTGHYVAIMFPVSCRYAYYDVTKDELHRATGSKLRDVYHTAPELYLDCKINLYPKKPVYDDYNHGYSQEVGWKIDSISDIVLDYITLFSSTDGGQTWKVADHGRGLQGTFHNFIEWDFGKVRYKAILYPKKRHRGFVENEQWESEVTADTEFPRISLNSNLEATDAPGAYTDDEDFYKRTYSTKLKWSLLESETENYFGMGKISLQYCQGDTDDEWITLEDDIWGSNHDLTDKVPVGYTKTKFRLLIYNKGQDQLAPVTYSNEVVVENNYQPAFSNIGLENGIEEGEDEEAGTLSPTLTYTMNDDLWQTRYGSLSVQYTTDGGTTWVPLTTVKSPKQEDKMKISVPSTAKEYQFRIGIASNVDNAIACGVENDSQVYSYFPTAIDQTEADAAADGPVNVYTLNGILVAKQIRPSQIQSTLPDGMYIVGNKVVVVKK